MPEVKRQILIVTDQKVVGNTSEEMPLRKWSIEIYLVGPDGNRMTANVFDKASYKLHETFMDRQIQSFKRAPFRIQEEGWGEFDMVITLTGIDQGGQHVIPHDLNFQNEHYETKHMVTFKNPRPNLLDRLKESGPVPGETNGIKNRDESAKKKKRPDKGIDMEKLADNLQKMNEDDLLVIVQMIHDNKSPDSWTKNDVDQGEFQVDLYTLPDGLVRQLWDFTTEKLGAR